MSSEITIFIVIGIFSILVIASSIFIGTSSNFSKKFDKN